MPPAVQSQLQSPQSSLQAFLVALTNITSVRPSRHVPSRSARTRARGQAMPWNLCAASCIAGVEVHDEESQTCGGVSDPVLSQVSNVDVDGLMGH